jgi:uncharacterized 2Fe-2S/4Fe-4S cluster protein (DUF4445 family)
MARRVSVTFAPLEAVAWVEPGVTVLEAAHAAGVVLQAPCGGRGICGACGVRVLEGVLDRAGETETRILAGADETVRLACHARVMGPVRVRPVISAQRAVGHSVSSDEPVAVAIDLGTTSISAVAIDPTSGTEWGRATVPNPQAAFGSDVMSRLAASMDGQGEALAEAATAGVLEAIALATANRFDRVSDVVIAGNTASEMLLARCDVRALATAPYVAPDTVELPADSILRAQLPPGVRVVLVSPIASFVGGDAAAGVVACSMLDIGGGPRLLVDIGTNAEVILAVEDRLFVASAAAGPAFEGSNISCGGVAAPGAASRIRVAADGTVKADVIGRGRARWLSGAAVVSALAELRQCGQVGADGALSEEGPLAGRVSKGDDGVRRVDLGDAAQPLYLTQLDIRAFQLAKAAVLVAIDRVLSKGGVDAGSLAHLWVSGAFGTAIVPEHLVELGVIPREAATVLEAAGNTSLQGAVDMLIDERAVIAAQGLARRATHVELATDADFAQHLMGATRLAPTS